MNIKTLIDARRLSVVTAAALAATPDHGSAQVAAPEAGSASVANDTLTIVGTNGTDQAAARYRVSLIKKIPSNAFLRVVAWRRG